MFKKNTLAAGVAAFASIAFVTGCAVADNSPKEKNDITAMGTDELAEHLIFNGGFRLDEPTQEGGTVRDRLQQDELQKLCSVEGMPDAETISRVVELARKSYEPPKGEIELGDWQKGATLARSGFGYRVGHKVDNHSKRDPGGNCYACHAMDPKEEIYGTIGPSLEHFGKNRGYGQETRKYVHQVIYNGHQIFPCTKMPRFGENKILTEEQIADVMAYLPDPESPVNQ